MFVSCAFFAFCFRSFAEFYCFLFIGFRFCLWFGRLVQSNRSVYLILSQAHPWMHHQIWLSDYVKYVVYGVELEFIWSVFNHIVHDIHVYECIQTFPSGSGWNNLNQLLSDQWLHIFMFILILRVFPSYLYIWILSTVVFFWFKLEPFNIQSIWFEWGEKGACYKKSHHQQKISFVHIECRLVFIFGYLE